MSTYTGTIVDSTSLISVNIFSSTSSTRVASNRMAPENILIARRNFYQVRSKRCRYFDSSRRTSTLVVLSFPRQFFNLFY